MKSSWALLVISALWLWVDVYPQWLAWQGTRARIEEVQNATQEFEEALKYLPAMRSRLDALPERPPPHQLKAPGHLQLRLEETMIACPENPERKLSGFKLSFAGSRPQLIRWLVGLCQHYALQKVLLRQRDGQVEGQAWLLEIR
ncbi:hypothetical protein JST97_25100 [bacterium]|nr:hypothetical protein [bacterium]